MSRNFKQMLAPIAALAASVVAVPAIFSTPAAAAVFLPGSANFIVSIPAGYTVSNAPYINATIGNTPTAAGTYTDDFEFTITQVGMGTGAIVTTSLSTMSSNYIDFLSVKFNGVAIPITTTTNPIVVQTATTGGVPIMNGFLNDLQVTYTTNGAGAYGGQLTFEAGSVPEAATWATFILGFAVIGMGLRRKQAAFAWAN